LGYDRVRTRELIKKQKNKMKNNKLLIVLSCLGLAMATSATTVTFTFQENGSNKDLGPSSTFTESGFSITANGFDTAGTASDLYAKFTSGDATETGLGMNNDVPDHEIDTTHFIQLNLSNLKGTTSCILTISSIQAGEGANVYATTSAGVPTSADILTTLSGSVGTVQTVDITAAVNAGDFIDIQATGGNVLIETLAAAVCAPITVSLSAPNPLPVCGTSGNQLTGPSGFATYSWTLVNPSAGWAITSGADMQTVTYTAGPSGSAEFQLTVTDSSGCPGTGDVTVSCSPPPGEPLVSGDTATIGFWHNKNGQALIDSLNGGPNATALGTWLAANFNCLFGNLNGQKNTAVAAQFLTYFGVTGAKTYAQIMGAALASYVTDSTLAGGTMAKKYGFNVSGTGTGDKVYNVGSDGSAIGLSNNTSYTVMQLLDAANANCSGGVINASAFNALNDIFDGINQTGDIK
jgi:hypothetical protein